jgi:hypothetical protein
MPFANWNLDFGPHNAVRKYPLASHATETDVSGSFTLPRSLLTSLYLPVPGSLDIDPTRFFLRSVTVDTRAVHITIGYAYENQAVVVARLAVNRGGHQEFQTYNLLGDSQAGYAHMRGRLQVGKFDDLAAIGYGHFVFDRTGGALDPDCVRPQLGGVTALYVTNGQDTVGPLFGAIKLVAGRNYAMATTILGDPETAPPIYQVQLSALEGTDLSEACDCTEDVALGPPIRRINQVGPNAQGEFYLLGGLCLEIEPAANGLTLRNPCSQPCCGRQELESLARQLEHFADQGATLRNAVSRLAGALEVTSSVVFASKLGDDCAAS